jgi:transporter, DASS family
MDKKKRNGLITIVVGAALWFAPVPAEVSVLAWHLMVVFIATVLGFILQPLPIGAVAFISITFAALSGLLKVSDALSGYGNPTIWLIVCAFLYSRGFIKSGLGKRIAFGIIRAIGKSALSLGYAITLSELVISPATPSATARGGGIMYPIVRSLAGALGSEPGESAKRIGTYLMQVGYHADAVTCTMFVTSMAGNPLCVALAAKALGVEVTWMGWASAAIVPGLISLILIPIVMMKLTKPELVSLPDAKGLAEKELQAMGPMSNSEKYLMVVFLGSLAFWATSGLTNIGATPVAMAAVCVMLVFDVINWKDVISEKGAWDAMFWMGSLMTLASALAKSGIITWVAEGASGIISSMGLGWVGSALILLVFYTYIHYCFASVTARISALYAAFIAVTVAVGAPPLLTAIVFGIFADVPISLTHYGNGCAPIYFGGNYVSQSEWWQNGFIMTTITTVIYLTIGAAWWKVLGLW